MNDEAIREIIEWVRVNARAHNDTAAMLELMQAQQAEDELVALLAELVRTREALAIAGPILEVIGDWLVSQQPPMPSEVEAELMRWCAESERFLRLAAAGSDGETRDG